MQKEEFIKKIPGLATAVEYARKASQIFLDEQGRQVVDGRPMAPPVGYKPSPSLADTVRALVHQVSDEQARAGEESLEDANDFYIEDDLDPSSPYEIEALSEAELVEELQRRGFRFPDPPRAEAQAGVAAARPTQAAEAAATPAGSVDLPPVL